MRTKSNRSRLSALIALAALATAIWAAGLTNAQQRGRPQRFQVPSDRFPTIQSAINAAANGDKILIAPGIYNETLTIAKRITLTGSGARRERQTAIVGQSQTEVVPLDRAVGVVNYQPNGGGKIEKPANPWRWRRRHSWSSHRRSVSRAAGNKASNHPPRRPGCGGQLY